MTPPPQRKQKKSVRIRGMTSSSPFLLLMMTCSKSFLKSASGTNKFTSILNRMSMKLHSRLDDFFRIGSPDITRCYVLQNEQG